MPGKVYLGCSGWSYTSWRPAFYPPKTSPKKLLHAYAERLNAVEVNYTFRALPTASILQNWLDETPAAFHFCPKAPQRITHLLRLRNASEPVARFIEAMAPIAAAGRLGPALFQLPPKFAVDLERLESVLAQTKAEGLRTAWEFRDASWFAEPVFSLLARYGATLCWAESDELETPQAVTTPAVAVFRLRRSGYSGAALDTLAKRFVAMARDGADVYAFFKHEEAPDGPLRAAHVLAHVPEELRG